MSQPQKQPEDQSQINLTTQPQSEMVSEPVKPQDTRRTIADQSQPQPVDQSQFQTPRIDNKPENSKTSGQFSAPPVGKTGQATTLETLESEKRVLEQLIQLLEQMKEKLHTRAEAFKALDKDGTGKIKKQQFAELLASENIGDEQSVDLFDKIAENGIITEKNWNEAWATTTFKLQQYEHQIKMITQKQAISKALESPISSQVEQAPQEESKIEGNKFQSIIEKCRNTSSLGDLSDIFTSLHISSPQRKEPIIPELLSTQLHFELPKAKSKGDTRFKNLVFQTPNKEDEILASQELTGRGSYLRNDVENKVISSRIPQESLRGSYGLRNKSPMLLVTQKQPLLSLRYDVNGRISQTMSVYQEGPKDFDKFNNKTSKRKDDLSQYMAKLGLGADPKVIADKPIRDLNLRTQVDKMRQILFQQQPVVTQKSGLSTLLQDPKFSQSQFRHGPRGSHDSKGGRSESQGGKDTFSLIDQSLKNYTLKLIHKHKYGGEKEGENRLYQFQRLFFLRISPQKRYGHQSIINY